MTTGDESLTEFTGEDGAVWLAEYKPEHAWAILWDSGQEVVRAWPEPPIGVPCHAEAAGLDAARTGGGGSPGSSRSEGPHACGSRRPFSLHLYESAGYSLRHG